MSQSRFQIKVGAFVFMGLLLLAVLILLLGKGATFYRRTYDLNLKSDNVGGIKTGAGVLLSGVSVGRVSGVDLSPDGKSVTIRLSIEEKYKIYDLLFIIISLLMIVIQLQHNCLQYSVF